MKFMNIRLLAGFCTVSFMVLTFLATSIADASFSQAKAQAISSIDVSGNQRIGRETILTYVTVEPGSNATPIEIDESLQALFATGLFKDVSISTRGSTLLVTVAENPIVNGIAFLGNDKLKDDQLAGILLTKTRGVFSKEQVEEDVERIKEVYKSVGRFNVVVKSRVETLESNRINVLFRIDEREKTGIAKINFVGNNAFGEGRLRNAIATRETGLLAFLQSNDIYDETRLAADEEQLRRFYFNNGYADFEVVSSVIDIDEKKNKFFITITVNEGERYRFGKIEIDSVLLDVNPDEFSSLVSTKEGDIYDARRVERTIEDLSLSAAGKGFAFAQVRPRGEQVDGQRINITYAIDQGPRVFVERINILGNTRTREYVIRREFDVAEGDAFNQALLTSAERRIRNLGIFRSVRVTRTKGSAPDRVVLNVNVEEQPTGDLSFGAGADLSGGFLTNAALTERNFLGRGQFVRLAAGIGTGNQTYDLSFTEPYFLGRRIAAGFDLFRRDSNDQDSRSFDVSNTGATLRFTLPITENFRAGISYTYNNENLSDIDLDDAPQSIIDQGTGDFVTSSVGYNLNYNTLDNNQDPTSGINVRFSQQFAGLGGDVNFVRTEARAAYYNELNANKQIIGLLRARAGNIIGIGEDVRLLDNFFAGGDLVRGFENRGIGPRENGENDVGDDALGGVNFFGVTAEVLFPAPLLPRSLGVKAALFADAGSVFGLDGSVSSDVEDGSDDLNIRSSVGLGLIWNSPFGPLRGDIAYVISEEDFDDTQFFRIGGGTRF